MEEEFSLSKSNKLENMRDTKISDKGSQLFTIPSGMSKDAVVAGTGRWLSGRYYCASMRT